MTKKPTGYKTLQVKWGIYKMLYDKAMKENTSLSKALERLLDIAKRGMEAYEEEKKLKKSKLWKEYVERASGIKPWKVKLSSGEWRYYKTKEGAENRAKQEWGG